MKLKKCSKCNEYTLKDFCDKCEKVSKDAHHKYIKIKDAPKSSNKIKSKK